MQVEHISPFLVLVWLCMATATRLSWTWSWVSREQWLLRLYPTSLESCLDVCSKKDDCQGVVFERLANLCDLHNILEPLNTQSGRGSIVVHRSEIMKRGLGLPYIKEPVHHDANVCSMSDLGDNKLLGNMNRAGDRIVVDYGTNATGCSLATFTCTDDGKWIQTDCKNKSLQGKPRDCHDFGENPLSEIYTIFPDGQSAVEVYCDFEDQDGPWTVIQRRVDDTVNFYRPYESYVEGFGNRAGNFWLGLDAIHTITVLSGRQYILKVVIEDTIEGVRYAEYSLFQVKDATSGYMLQVDGYSGNAGDSLAPHNGHPFSAYDMDRDRYSRNCAAVFTGAWWYDHCHKSNLNGKYGDDRFGKGLNWYTTTGHRRSATFATMKLKARE